MDCAVKPLLRALRDYDPQLYLRWNPNKRDRLGIWEVRRRPEKLSPKEIVEFKGNTYTLLDYVENNLVNHVLDCKTGLNYGVVQKIKEMDTWGDKNWVRNLEYDERKHWVGVEDKALKEMKYGLKQYKSAAKDLKELVLSGTPLTELARHWGRKAK